MARVRFHDARMWRYIIASIEKILDEGVFILDEEGMRLRALDAARIAMVDLFYPASAMTDYEVEGEESFGVSFGVLAKVLRRARKEDQLELRIGDSSIDIIFLGRGVRRFRIPQISLTYEKPGEPRIGFTVTARMMATTFREAVRVVEPVADIITLAASEDKFIMRGVGDIESAELEFSMERGSLLDLQVDSPDESNYPLEYFSQMLQAAQAAEVAVVNYAAEAPVRIDMEFTGGGRLTFYVSPSL